MNKSKKNPIKCSLCGAILLKNPNERNKPYWVMRKLYPDRPPVCDGCAYEMFTEMEYQDEDVLGLLDDMESNYSESKTIKKTDSLENHEKSISEILQECTLVVKNQEEQLKNIIRSIKHNISATNKYTKTNIMIIGSTGTGKTLIANTVAKALDVSHVIVSATDYTEVGYYGKDVEEMLQELYKASGRNISKTERGIVFIDEIDKKNSSDGIGRDVSGAKVIESLLTMLQGTKVTLPSMGVTIDTSFITFVVMGVFEDLKKVKEKRLNQKQTIGFSQMTNLTINKTDVYIAEDIEKIGFNSQFTARFSNIIELSDHTKESLFDIVKNSKASGITPWSEEFKKYNIDLQVTELFLDEVVNQALALKVGARGISRILNEMMLYVLNDVVDSKIRDKICLLDKSTLDDFKSYEII